MTLPASRLAPLNTSSMGFDSLRADSDSSSSADESPKTPSSSMTLSGSPPSSRGSKQYLSVNPPAFNMSSLSCSSASSSSSEDLSTDMRDDKEDMEPVFSALPTRRARSSGTITGSLAGGLGFSTMSGMTCSNGSGSERMSPISRRTPSFPVSRPIRPFDSISNAMGTQPKRVSPTTEAPFAASKTLESSPKSNAVIAAEPAQLDSKPKPWRSSKLIEPPKNNRFQNGFFILDMTQDEFKSRAW